MRVYTYTHMLSIYIHTYASIICTYIYMLYMYRYILSECITRFQHPKPQHLAGTKGPSTWYSYTILGFRA